jgi:hypothetical protein
VWLKKREFVPPIWSDSSLCRILRAWVRLVQTWWQSDRVRGMSSEGRILRLRPSALIIYEGRQIEVVGCNRDGAELSYECRADDDPVEVRVTLAGPNAPPQITWIERGEERLLTESELEIWEMLGPTEIVK